MRMWTRAALVVAATVGMTVPALAGPKDAQALARIIDKGIDQQLQAANVKASPKADDAEFLRRVYLDLTGVIPPADKAAAFLDSTDANKREKLIDELLADPKYGTHLADIWVNMMFPRESGNRRVSPEPLHKWLAEEFNKNTEWNKLVTELVTASGTQSKNGAVTYFLANPTVDKVTDNVSRLFLGVQLECAQCHNHPFTSWKRNEYWGMAAFFSKVRPDRPTRDATDLGVAEANGKGKGVRLPESAKIVPAKFLMAEEPKLNEKDPYRPVLATWMTAGQNPFFAKAMVNRTWGHFFGRGFVNPIDDMHEGNKPSHPELLKEMSARFVDSGFDLKHLAKAICLSNAYQRSSKPSTSKADDDNKLFGHMNLKPMSPEELYDSLTAVVGAGNNPNRERRPQQANRGQGNNPRVAFVNFFRADEGANPIDFNQGIPQALRLMNSPQFNRGGQTLDQAIKSGKNPAEIVEKIYLGTVSRRPSASETQRLTSYVQKSDNARDGYTDILWAVLNSSEFGINH